MPGSSLLPSQHPTSTLTEFTPAFSTARQEPPAPGPLLEESGIPWQRYFAALRRYKWLIIAFVLLGGGGGFALARLIKPTYEVQATIWITSTSQNEQSRTPIRAGELLRSVAWVELLRSYAIAEAVVNKLHLYVSPVDTLHAAVFRSFEVTPQVRSGRYFIQVDPDGQRYTLLDTKKNPLERGVAGDSVGRQLGMRWAPGVGALPTGVPVEFRLVAPRTAALGLLSSLEVSLPEESNFLSLRLSGRNPGMLALILNTWADEFVNTAGVLKRRQVTGFQSTLADQLKSAERELQSAETALRDFESRTIMLPSKSVVAGGVEATRQPVLDNFFQRKAEYDDLRHDREALQTIVERARRGEVQADAIAALPSITSSSPLLQNALADLANRQTQLRALRQTYTDEHPSVRAMVTSITRLERETIPALSQTLLDQLRQRETELARRIQDAEDDMRGIPPREIEAARLARQVTVTANLYNTVKSRYEEAKLAEAAVSADVTVLDRAVAPQAPSRNTAPRVILLALVVSFGGAIGLVLLLDRLDRRFRYPDQATHELRLPIVGTVPAVVAKRRAAAEELAAEVLESFRALRMNVRFAFPTEQRVAVAISSAGPGDGKSLVAANLALSFAEAGLRTVLVDADIRRGTLHAVFDIARVPGLVDYLSGAATREDIVRPTSSERLTIIPCGTRRQRGPELLTSPRLIELVHELRAEYDVVLIDTPPLCAGIDAYVLSSSVQNMLMVLRTGSTDRKMAEAKLKLVDQLPIRVIGAVLNDFEAKGDYRYYGYSYSYSGDVENDAPELPAVRSILPRR